MTRSLQALMPLAVLATLAACGDGLQAPVNVTTADLEGRFLADRAVVVNPVDVSQQFDIVRAGGSFSLVVDGDGNFEREVVLPGRDAVVGTGSLAVVDGRTLVLTEDDPALQRDLRFDFQGDRLRLIDTRSAATLARTGGSDPVVMTVDLRRVR